MNFNKLLPKNKQISIKDLNSSSIYAKILKKIPNKIVVEYSKNIRILRTNMKDKL